MSRRRADSPRRTQERTAALWAKRAIAAYRRAGKSGSMAALMWAEDCRHEALEHAALVGDFGRCAARTQRAIDKARGLIQGGRR